MKKEILLITDLSYDDKMIRKKLEDCAFSLYGNLNGFRINEEKKVVYTFEFKDKDKINKFKEIEMIKNYDLMEIN